MSNIPKNKRSPSPLQVVRNAYVIRRALTLECLEGFGYDENKRLKALQKRLEKEPEEKREEYLARENVRQKSFYAWYIPDERERIINAVQDLVNHLVAANTIYPVNQVECEERRLELDRALECCNRLEQELNYIAETLPNDLTRFGGHIERIQAEYRMIKALRKSDNRFGQRLNVQSASSFCNANNNGNANNNDASNVNGVRPILRPDIKDL